MIDQKLATDNHHSFLSSTTHGDAIVHLAQRGNALPTFRVNVVAAEVDLGDALLRVGGLVRFIGFGCSSMRFAARVSLFSRFGLFLSRIVGRHRVDSALRAY